MDTRPLYNKFQVRRTDGRDAPGEKHDDCTYFVLDLTHDPFAVPAIRAYAEACRESHPGLANGLEAWLQGDTRRTYEAVRTPAADAEAR